MIANQSPCSRLYLAAMVNELKKVDGELPDDMMDNQGFKAAREAQRAARRQPQNQQQKAEWEKLCDEMKKMSEEEARKLLNKKANERRPKTRMLTPEQKAMPSHLLLHSLRRQFAPNGGVNMKFTKPEDYYLLRPLTAEELELTAFQVRKILFALRDEAELNVARYKGEEIKTCDKCKKSFPVKKRHRCLKTRNNLGPNKAGVSNQQHQRTAEAPSQQMKVELLG